MLFSTGYFDTYQDKRRRDVFPADKPPPAGLVTEHFFAIGSHSLIAYTHLVCHILGLLLDTHGMWSY